MWSILNSYLRNNETYRSGICPDSQCKSYIVFTSTDYQVQCVACGQRHQSKNLLNVEDLDSNNGFRAMRTKLHTQKPIELIKVNGISNFQCVLISPLLSHYGMNREGQAELLGKDRIVEKSDFLDCAKIFSSRTFLIDKDHIDISGYGRDPHGYAYLKETLSMLFEANEGEERLIPLHADGDGHCLVHAVSKCLMGREMFWHPLRLNLVNHLKTSLDMYKAAFKEFMVDDEHEWDAIIRESHPNYTPPDDQTSGLRNIHIFALSNILRRPIILLDKLTHIINAGDYAATFLPAFIDPVACTDTATGEMNKPIVIAWNSRAHNHFIPLVGIKNRSLPVMSRDLLPKVWGVDQSQLEKYIQFDGNMCVIGGKKCMPDGAILKLFSAMERLFFEKYCVSTGLVSEFNSCMKRNMLFGTTTNDQKWMIDSTNQLIKEGKLFRCLNCRSLNVADENSNKTAELFKRLMDASAINTIVSCEVCPINSPCRLVSSDGSTIYQNGDRTTTPSQGSNCGCGFKHYWDGNEYDNVPLEVPIRLEFNQRQVDTKIAWFQDDSDPSLNSNAYDIAGKIVNEFFPGDFGSEILIRGVVDMILKRVSQFNSQLELQKSGSKKNEEIVVRNPYMETSTITSPTTIPPKIISTGFSKHVLHKESLGKNKHEKDEINRIQTNAPHQQSRATNEARRKASASNLPSPTKSQTKEAATTPTKPKPAVKKTFKLTYKQEGSPARHLVQEITPDLTFRTLVSLASNEFGISQRMQRFKVGFPPRQIKMELDDTLEVSNGDSITVEKIETATLNTNNFPTPRSDYSPVSERTTPRDPMRSSPSRSNAADLLNGISEKIDLYESAAREQFQKGGIYYSTFMKMFDSEPPDNHHFQFYLMPKKTFSYSKESDEFVLCLDGVHIYVQPITEQLMETIEKKKKEAIWGSTEMEHAFSNAIKQQTRIEPFGGSGTRLGTAEQETIPTQTFDPLQDPSIGQILSLAGSSSVLSPLTQQINDEDPDSIVHSKYPDDDMSTSD